MEDINKDWYTYLTEDFKMDRSYYKSAMKAVVDCPKCEMTDCVRVGHLKTKIKKLGYYECSKCRKQASIKRARKAFKEKYNVENPGELKEVKDKIKKTNLKKYGVESLLKLKEYRNSNLRNTPYINISQLPEIKEKTKETMNKKYGGFNFSRPKVLEKAHKSLNSKRESLKKLLLPKIIKDLEKNNSTISSWEFYSKYQVSYTTIINWVKEAGRSDLIRCSKTEEILGVDSLGEAGNILSNFIKDKKVPALSDVVCKKFGLSRPSVKKALFAAGEEDLIGRYKSAKELELYEFIKSIIGENEIIRNDRKIIFPKELDILIPSKNLAIEFNGLYWHDENHLDKKYHMNKRLLCEDKSISLLQFLEDEWDFKSEIVKSIIKQKLGKTENRIFARKTDIKKVKRKDSEKFLEDNHLMGSYRSGKSIGLYYNSKLVAILVYKKIGKTLEISRFCNLLNTQVVGGLSKLLNFAIKEESPQEIRSYVDMRYSNGSSLKALGFEKKSTTLGWKWTDWDKTYNRLYCRANMDERCLTQKQHSVELGLHKIYDAGQTNWIKKLGV